ncbi:hypothetical protein HUJ05_004463 [Dendroctonus ponderosae]|nr:hypothetical protein HUJ05_004463 [Dendroctonus ponderosae]
MYLFLPGILVLALFSTSSARIHKLPIKNDVRRYISLSTFGFCKGGTLAVNLTNFHASPENENAVFGFSLDRAANDARNYYLDTHQDVCILEQDERSKNDSNKDEFIYLTLDLKTNKLHVTCAHYQPTTSIHIYKSSAEKDQSTTGRSCKDLNFDITQTILDFDIEITEQNVNGYLSAGEMPLPALFCMMSILFFLSGMFWVFLLKQSKHPVFKIHYMMAVLVFLKAISLAFHGVNYHYIEQLGFHLTTWAILFYVAHLLKGALLFVVLVLVGTGWTFIKYVLTPKDKKLFMVVIPLQVLANLAQIILEESEEGDIEYLAWRNVVIMIDLLCCGGILFPVVWSIRHLQEASETDGKAAINLRKLKLFRHFYIMVVCYIYSTRIIVYLLKITVPFQYGWLHEMFREMATYVFFVLTAYKFRPASQNPYFALHVEEEDLDEVLTETGATEGLRKVNSRLTKVPFHETITEVTEEEKDALLGQSESSHDYD